jgi:hypothetical protein
VSLLKGPLTFRRFFSEGGAPSASSSDLVELLIHDRFLGRLDDPRKEERSGWVTVGNLLDTDFSVANTYFAPYMLFSQRTDKKAIPPALLRALVERETAELLKSTGMERLPPGGKAEIREQLEEKYLPQMLPSVSVVEVCWNLQSGMVRVLSTSERAVGRVRKAFSATFSQALYGVDAPRLAMRGPEAAQRRDRIVLTSASDLSAGDDLN